MISLKDISVKFNRGSVDEVDALRSINLEIGEREFVTVIGTNGSGKSTLLNVIAGNILADEGQVKLCGRDVTRLPAYRRADSISRVFQNPYMSTAPDMSIAENLLMAWFRGKKRYPGFSLNKKLMAEFSERLKELEMGLEDRLNNAAGTLSGGQRQAITLLMAVLRRPDVLLLDEHTAALDPKTGAQVTRLTNKFIEDGKLTALMVTHSMKQALEMGNRIIMMHGGRIISDIPAKEKELLTVEDLLLKFENIRKKEKLTPEMLANFRRQYA
ncbi:MAG: ATP-binding cassette domain-containing protein [Bacteroidetes bacterium]|nr:ATP-binding cassette domain-containing protein [Bacteroidota bacterium]